MGPEHGDNQSEIDLTARRQVERLQRPADAERFYRAIQNFLQDRYPSLSETDREDITSEAIAKMLALVETSQVVSRKPIQNIFQLALRIAITTTLDHFRSKHHSETSINTIPESLSSKASSPEEQAQISYALSKLTQEERGLVELRFAGYTQQQIAELHESSTVGIHRRLKVIWKKLEKLLISQEIKNNP